MKELVLYETRDRVAYLTLNRPAHLNAIDDRLPFALRDAVDRANRDDHVHCIVLSGAGKGFCGGYDLEVFAERPRPVPGSQEMPWDPMLDYRLMNEFTQCYMSLFRAYKPTIAKVHGAAVAGGSDIALCCDLVVMAEDARIGYPPARVWGCPTTAMWVYRLGPEGAKRMLFTGDLVTGREAFDMGLVGQCVPAGELDEAVEKLTRRIASVPLNQLQMHKLLVNQSYANQGLESTQMFANVFDGIARHTPEGVEFKERCEEVGFKQAVRERDQGD